MKISRITKQKRGNRYNIFITVDNKEFFGFGVDEDILVQHHLHKGMSLSDELVETLKRLDHLNKFYRQAINYLSYRMRSRLEVVQYLRRKEVEPTHLTEIRSEEHTSELQSRGQLVSRLLLETKKRQNKTKKQKTSTAHKIGRPTTT